MRIVADEDIPLLNECFAPWGEVVRRPGRAIARADLLEADALLVRSITKVNAALVANTRLRFVGSTTSGVDHVDRACLSASNIEFAHAPGCNADAVVDYVCSALAALGVDLGQPAGMAVGIVGFGQVGSRLAERLGNLGFKIKAYDPFLKSYQNKFLASWDDIRRCDIVSLHVPLTRDGGHPTRYLLDAAQLAALPQQLILINAARGAVIDNQALCDILPARPAWQTVLDVWQGEPEPNRCLLRQVDIATPHIAGHSLQAKCRGTHMVYQAFLRCFFAGQAAQPPEQTTAVQPMLDLQLTKDSVLNDVVLAAYDVRDDADALTALADTEHIGREFERLRKHYRVRHEFSACRLKIENGVGKGLIKRLKYLKFNA